MKKVIICASALLASSLALAQTPQEVAKKTKKPQELSEAREGSNFSQIDQIGIYSESEVYQQGTENASYIDQTGNATQYDRRNRVGVQQLSGDVLTSSTNYSDVTQNGSYNWTYVDQYGDNHESFANVKGYGNDIYIYQGDDEVRNSEKLYADVTQTGDWNYIEVYQEGEEQVSLVNQYSKEGVDDGNDAYQEQGYSLADKGNTGIINQAGTLNEANQRQENETGNQGNYAQIDQGKIETKDLATESFAEQLQDGSGRKAFISQRLEGNEADQMQTGTDNTAIAEQNGALNRTTGGYNFSIQDQEGDRNKATVKQPGVFNTSYQQQIGKDNTAWTVQQFGDQEGNLASTLQDGRKNNAITKQGAHGNVSWVDQNGGWS